MPSAVQQAVPAIHQSILASSSPDFRIDTSNTTREALGMLARLAAAARSGQAVRRIAGARWLSTLPPHSLLPMPALSPTMTMGNLAAWKKKEGDEIGAGDIIAEVETDKATVDYEAVDEGVLAKLSSWPMSRNHT